MAGNLDRPLVWISTETGYGTWWI